MAAMRGLTRAYFEQLDRRDALAAYRAEFELPDLGYLDGNSLGALSRRVRERIRQVVEREWGEGLIRSWTAADWITLPRRVGDKLAVLIGAESGEVVAADSTSVNLFKLAAAAMRASGRTTMISELGNFPTDLYVLQGLADFSGGRFELKALARDALMDSIDGHTGLVALTHVHYKSAAMHDMRAVTEAAHRHGALVLWDLSHSTGAVPVELNATQADLAVGCSYKYLNAGPGGPAYLYVAKRHQHRLMPPLSGWMGHAEPFAFSDRYEPAEGIARQLCGTPSVIAMAAMDAAVDIVLEAGMERIREKSLLLGDLFIRLLETRCGGDGFELISPRRGEQRGSHVSFAHPHGYAVMQALIARGFIGDFRAPDVMRFGFAPLYQRYVDVWDCVDALAGIMRDRAWDDPAYRTRAAVT